MIPNEFLQEPLLNWGAKLILFFMLSCAEGWVFEKKDIMRRLRMAWGMLQKSLKELKDQRFLVNIKQYSPNNQFAKPGYLFSDIQMEEKDVVDKLAAINANQEFKWRLIKKDNNIPHHDDSPHCGKTSPLNKTKREIIPIEVKDKDPLHYPNVNNGFLTKTISSTTDFVGDSVQENSIPGQENIPGQNSYDEHYLLRDVRRLFPTLRAEHVSIIEHWLSMSRPDGKRLHFPTKDDTTRKFMRSVSHLTNNYSLSDIMRGIDYWAEFAFADKVNSRWHKPLWDLVTDKKGNLGKGGELISILKEMSKPPRRLNRIPTEGGRVHAQS